jgi:hypothetical protein
MREISLHILDIAQNSLAAGAANVAILVEEDYTGDLCTVEIRDDGRGMTEPEVNKSFDPFFTTRKTRKVGLGLSLLKANAEACNGGLEILSTPGRGTIIRAWFRLSHLDRPPLGDIASTMMSLIGGNPSVEFSYEHRCGGEAFVFSTAEIRKVLEGAGIDHPDVLFWIKEYITEQENELRKEKEV